MILSIGLGLAGAGVLGTWAYKSYFSEEDTYKGELITLKPVDSLITLQPVDSKAGQQAESKQTLSIGAGTSKSTSVVPMESSAESELMKPEMYQAANTAKPAATETAKEINKLKAEIAGLLKKQNNDADLKMARQKIEELQQKVEKLTDKNSDIEKENKKLFAVLRRLSDERLESEQKSKAWPVVYENKAPETNKPAANTTATAKPNTVNTGNTSANTAMATDDIRLSAFTVTDTKEIETSQAFLTDKFTGSFTLRSAALQNAGGEVIVVITQPDGKVLQKSSWESGTFQTAEGKKVYSCRLRFDGTGSDQKKLNFSIAAPNFIKGNYTMQIYCKGVLIGKLVKSLS